MSNHYDVFSTFFEMLVMFSFESLPSPSSSTFFGGVLVIPSEVRGELVGSSRQSTLLVYHLVTQIMSQ